MDEVIKTTLIGIIGILACSGLMILGYFDGEAVAMNGGAAIAVIICIEMIIYISIHERKK